MGAIVRKRERNCKSRSGFTLVELMVTVAIVGILASIAYPSYVEYVRRANRADAQAIMMENAQYMERYFTTNGTYLGSTPLPKPQSPASGTPKYNITAPAATLLATSYIIQAVPTAAFPDPLCGTLTVSQTGARTESGTGSQADCWKN